MRIKTLQITGFKSFVDKTVLSFSSGLTAIVGPNGCGKSNVVDAMRWAMGEQSPRRLRGKGMDDVIFAGSDARESVGMAEVVLSFDNREGRAPAAFSGFTEIQVTRRLFRTGESEYEINKTPCRMRDVLDFFRDTGIGTRGYTIVEQGQIAAIVSAKAEERRQLIEEAAGISKYKARRREAERKLDSTQQNLLRVNDVLGEIRRQITSLERQAKKAARYKRFKDRLRLLDLSLAADERRELSAALKRAQTELETQRVRSEEAATRLSEREARLERLRLELTERERGVVAGSETLFTLRGEIKTLESRMEYEERERQKLGEDSENRRAELQRLQEQRSQAAADERSAGEELARISSELDRENEALAELESAARLAAERVQGLEREREAHNTRVVERLTELARAEDRSAALEERGSVVANRLRRSDEALEVQQGEVNRAGAEQRELEEGLRNLLVSRDQLMQSHRDAMRGHGRREQATREAAERLAEVREQRDLRRARLSSLREVVERAEDLGDGTRHLVAQGEAARAAHGIRAMVRDVLEIDADAERAVEAVLRERAEAMAVSGLEGALSAVESLRRGNHGGAVFVVEAPEELPSRGFVPLGEALLDHVRVRSGYEGVAQTLLGSVNLVTDLDEVIKVYGSSRLPATFVTSGGDVLTPDGVLRGGAAGGNGTFARMRVLRELEGEVAGLDARCEAFTATHREAEAALAAASDELDNLRNRHHTAALAVAGHEKDLERTRERFKALGEAQEGRSAERSELVTEGEQMERERAGLEVTIRAVRVERDRLQTELDELAGKIGSAARERQRVDVRLTERRVSRGTRVERREQLSSVQERAAAQLAEATEWIARRQREIGEMAQRRDELSQTSGRNRQHLAETLEKEQRAREEADRARDHFESLAGEIRSHDDVLRRLRGETTAQRERAQQLEIEAREASLRGEQLDERIRDRWQIELATWTPPELRPASDAAEQHRAQRAEGERSSDQDVIAPTTNPEGERSSDQDVIAPATNPEGERGPNQDASASATAAQEDEESAEALDAENACLLEESTEVRRQALEEARRRLESIGEVNLGAIEEHEELRERFRFLNEQRDDLERTVNSLREAITRINRASRRRFRETFDAVNDRFQKNFPRLFEGGKAALSLAESEDVLEAGIEIMAQPPGKRLQNVTLLSGGEKTLTACALLVSMFQVHPSPFFLLDEVDAALDDANVGRLNEIIREMAAESQFLLITHNKATIETADQLYGVTMEEKGVSKIVGVELREDVSA